MIAVRSSLNEQRIANAEAVAPLRHAVAEYAEKLGLSPSRVDDVRLAVSEAVTNVVLHAYEKDPGYVLVSASAVGDELWVIVTDGGRGHNAAPLRPGLGWGLAFIADACDEFTLAERSEGGTEARMVFRLPRAEAPRRD